MLSDFKMKTEDENQFRLVRLPLNPNMDLSYGMGDDIPNVCVLKYNLSNGFSYCSNILYISSSSSFFSGI